MYAELRQKALSKWGAFETAWEGYHGAVDIYEARKAVMLHAGLDVSAVNASRPTTAIVFDCC